MRIVASLVLAGFLTGSSVASADQTSPPQRRDSVLNGVLIGALVGGLLGLIPDYYDDCGECHDSLYASIAVGAGVGLLIDALRSADRPANPSVNGRHVRVTVGKRAVGVRAVFRWSSGRGSRKSLQRSAHD